jgi:hypothetical protein
MVRFKLGLAVFAAHMPEQRLSVVAEVESLAAGPLRPPISETPNIAR